MLFRPDRAYRDAVVGVLKRFADPETADAVIAECKGKPEAAVRSAAGTLFALGIPGTEQRLAELAVHGKGETQEIVRRLLLDAPVSGALAPVLWHLAAAGRVEDRVAFLARLASVPIDAKALPRWHRLARDPEKAVREKVLAVLAQHDAGGSVDLFVEQLALVDYSTQQVLVGALTRAAAGQGAAFADRILPLMAAGEAGTRSVVLKILLGMPDRRDGGAPLHRLLEDPRRLGPRPRARVDARLRRRPSRADHRAALRPGPGGARLRDAGGPVLRGPAHRAGHDRAPQGPGLVDPHHRRRDPGPPEGPARGPAPRRGALRPGGALERGRGARPDRRPAGGARPLGAAPGPRPRGADRGHPGPEPLRAPADARLRAQRGEAGPLARRPRAGPRDRPARWRRAAQTTLADEDGAQAGGARREVGRGRAEAQRPPRGHAQQRGLRPPPLGRPAPGPPPRRRPRPRPGRALHRGADRGHGPRDPDRRAVGEAAAGEAARLLPLHPDRRALPGQRLRRPAGHRTASSA